MFKKAGFVAATAAGLMLLGSTAYANPAEADDVEVGDGSITYEEAYYDFQQGGAAAGYGAATMVAAAYTGVSLTPAHVAEEFSTP